LRFGNLRLASEANTIQSLERQKKRTIITKTNDFAEQGASTTCNNLATTA
jgi:hypothetical protein